MTRRSRFAATIAKRRVAAATGGVSRRLARIRRSVWLAVASAAAFSAAPSGCVVPNPTSGPIHLAPSSRPFERDIPVPIGFVFVESSSEDASSGARRLYLRHTYAGESDKISVRNFFREQMPLARWVKISDSNVKGEYTLQYQKDAELCMVRVRDWPGVRGRVEVVVVITRQRDDAPPLMRRQP